MTLRAADLLDNDTCIECHRRYRLDDWPPACDHQVGLCSGCRDECGECE